jgi:hypothetical protein
LLGRMAHGKGARGRKADDCELRRVRVYVAGRLCESSAPHKRCGPDRRKRVVKNVSVPLHPGDTLGMKILIPATNIFTLQIQHHVKFMKLAVGTRKQLK